MQAQNGQERQRLDKWLYFARFVKTRRLAALLVMQGYVRVNGQKVENIAKALLPGDVLTLALGQITRVVRVDHLAARRGPAPEARLLYSDLTSPLSEEALLVSPESNR